MLIIAAIVLGLLSASSKLVPIFRSGVEALGQTIITKYLNNAPDICDPSKEKC